MFSRNDNKGIKLKNCGFLFAVCVYVCVFEEVRKTICSFLKKENNFACKIFFVSRAFNKHETDSNSTQTQINNLGFTQGGIPSGLRTHYSQRSRKRRGGFLCHWYVFRTVNLNYIASIYFHASNFDNILPNL